MTAAPAPATLRRVLLRGASALLALMLLAVLLVPERLLLRALHTWNVYHYVIGSKYFDELGYLDLYPATILADAEGQRRLVTVPGIRDLSTYDLIPYREGLRRARASGVKQRFSAARWREFQADVGTLVASQPPRFWIGPLGDRGFNPSPAWLLLHRPLLGAVRTDSGRALFFLCYLQLLLLGATFVGIWWAYGGRAALLSLVLLVGYFGNGPRVLGGYFSYDWFCLSVGAVVLYRKERYVLAGACLAYAAAMRGFPALLALYPALQVGLRAVRLRRPERRHLGFLGSALAVGLLVVGASALTRPGPAAWRAWRAKITVHAHHHVYSASRIGLPWVFSHDPRPGRLELSRVERRRVITRNAPARTAGVVLLAALLLLAMVRRDDDDGFRLSVGVILATMVLSRYYLSVFVLFVMFPPGVALARARWVLTGFLIALVTVVGICVVAQGEAHHRLPYLVFNLGLVAFLLGYVGIFLASDLREWRAAREGSR